MITYKITKEIPEEQVRALYESVGWTSYREIADVRGMLQACQLVYTAWDKERLVGSVRAVGDGAAIQYVQDLLVHPDYQNKGIGTHLIQYALEKSKHIRQLVLITDGSPETKRIRDWYEKQGLGTLENNGLVGYYRRA